MSSAAPGSATSGGPASSPAAISLLSFLQTELLVLSNEARRKNPEIKDALDKVFAWLRELKESPVPVDITAELGKSHDLLVPLLLASRTGQPKMLSIAVSCLHRLITFNALSLDHDTAEVVFEVLTEAAVKGNDEIQQKSLMCVMPLLANSVSNIHGPQLVQAYLIGFRLHELASLHVKNAAVAIVRQLIIWLFEQVAEEDAHGIGEDRPFAVDACSIFQDICLLLNDEKPQVLALNSIDKSFALELIESVLAFHSLIFRQHPEYVTIVREKICTVAIRSFTEGSSFPHTSRLWRVVGVLLRDFHDLLPLEAEIFISFLPRILDDDAKVGWEKNLVLETARDVFSDHGLMLELFEICDRRLVEGQETGGPKVFQDIVFSICNHIGREARRAAEAGLEVDYSQADIKISLLSQFDKDLPPTVPPLYSLHLSFESMAYWIQGMLQVLRFPHQFSPSIQESNQDCKDLLEKSWRFLTTKGLFSLFGTSLKYEWRRLLFGALEDLGRITCLFGMSSQLQHLIESLFQLDPSMHLYAWQSILTLAIEHPSMIQGSWLTVVKVLRSVDIFTGMKARKISYTAAVTVPVPLSALESPAKKVQNLGAASPAMTSQVELDKIASLSGLAKDLMDKSVGFEEETFTAFITALADGASQSRSDLSLINRLRQATLNNLGRFLEEGKDDTCEAWLVMQRALLLFLSLEDGQMRGQAIEFLGSLTQGYMSTSTDSFKSHLGFQTRLISLLHDSAIPNSYRDVQQLVMDVTGKLIQTVGPALMPDAWLLFFQFLAEFLDTDKGHDLQLLRATFYCAKLVSSDFLACLGDRQMEALLGLLNRFVQQTDDLNIGLTAIGLLWDISDFLRLGLPTNLGGFSLWLTALDLLVSTSTDARPELRNSAVQTLTRTVELFALLIKPDQWDKLLRRILLPLLQAVHESAEAASNGPSTSSYPSSDMVGVLHHSRDSASKQWDETLVLVIQGTVKIFSDCFPTLSALKNFDSYWDRLMSLLERSCGTGKSIEVVSVSLACFKHIIQALQRIENGSESTWSRAWQTWSNISTPMSAGDGHESFTQESLAIFVGCFGCFLVHFAPKSDLAWLKSSLSILDAALRCHTPTDTVRDTEQASPLQHTILQQIQSVDFGGYGLEAKVHLARLLAAWMELAPELKSLEMTRAASVRRTRHSVPPSRPSLSPLLPATSKGQATFIAFSFRILGLIDGYFTKWKTDADIYKQAYTIMVRAVGRLMVLKYRAASPTEGEAAWKLATRSLNSIFLATPKDLLDASCWTSLVEVLEKSLESSRRMVPVELAVDQLNSDEDFDIEQVGFIKEHVLPEMQLASEETVGSLLASLERSSHLYYLKSDSPKLTTIEVPQSPGPLMNSRPPSTNPSGNAFFRHPTVSAFSELVPVIKERFAIRCLQTLFDICSSTSKPILSPNVVKVALGILLKRTQSVMQFYVEEKRLQGGMPFPRVRQDEMLFVLSASVSLRIPTGLAAEALLPPPSDETAGEDSFDQKRHLFSTEIGHLFYLYPTLCTVMEITDPDISDLVRQAFTTIGQSCHLIP